jgi:hypothetical protein
LDNNERENSTVEKCNNDLDVQIIENDHLPGKFMHNCYINSFHNHLIAFVLGPSTSKTAARQDPRQITFNVNFKSSQLRIQIAENKTVGDLKQQIMRRTSVPVCRQLLKGVPHEQIQNHSLVLKSLKLPNDVNLELTDMSDEGVQEDVIMTSSTSSNVDSTYQLRIKYTNEDRFISLNFPATKTMLDIKNDLNAVLKIPVRFQKWEGWPASARNDTKLSDMGIDQIHSLQLTNSRTSNDNSNANNMDST